MHGRRRRRSNPAAGAGRAGRCTARTCDGRFGANKRWDYWAILAGDLVVSAVYSDIDHFGLADVYWADLVTRRDRRARDRRAARRRHRASRATRHRAAARRSRRPRPAHRRRRARHAPHARRGPSTTADAGRLDVTVALPPGHESLNVVIPWSDELFNFTSKHQARPGDGRAGGRRPAVGDRRSRRRRSRGACSTSGRGRWPARDHLELGRRRRPVRRPRRRPPVRRQVDGGHRLHRERPDRRRPALQVGLASCAGTTTGTTRCGRGASSIPAVSSTSC